MNPTSRACWTFSRRGEKPVAKVVPFFGAVNRAAMSGLCTHSDQSASPQR